MRNDKQPGVCLSKISCPSCNSSDANQVYSYEDRPNDSYCFACDTYHPPSNVVVPIKPYRANTMKDLEHIKALPILGIEDRKITKDTASTYMVRASLSEED